MKKNSHPIDSVVAEIARVHDEELVAERYSDGARALFEGIVSTPVADAPSGGGRRAKRADSVRARERPVARRVSLLAAAVCALAAGFAVAGQMLLDAPTAAAGVEIARTNRFFVARVVDLNADPDAMRAAFRERGLDIELRLVPVSPSLVGEIVAMSDTAEGITGLPDPETGCPEEMRCGPIGLRIPLDFRGEADITLGREAEAGELYVSAGDAFAPGEVLHCSGLLGAPVRHARDALARRGVRAVWHVDELIDGSHVGRTVESPEEILDRFVVEASPRSSGSVDVFTAEAVPDSPQYERYRAAMNEGC